MKTHPNHHIHLLGHISLAMLGVALSLTGLLINSQGTSAQVPTVFQGPFAGRDARETNLHWNYGGNDFEGLVFWGNHKTLSSPVTVNINGDTKSCSKQVRGLYYNSARGQVLRPLDQDSLDALRQIDSSYNNLDDIEDGLYIGCDGNTTNVFGQVTHTINGLERKLVAGVDLQTNTNTYTHAFANTLTFNNGDANGYLVDSIGGIADVDGVAPLYQSTTTPTPTPPTTTTTTPQTTIVGTGTPGFVVSVQVGSTQYTGIIGSDGYFEIPITVTPGDNTIFIILTNPETQQEEERVLTITYNPPVIPPSGGGGGAPVLKTDEQLGICEEQRDCSDSYYDLVCGPCEEHNSAENDDTAQEPTVILIDSPINFIKQVGETMKSMNCDITQELVESYVFSYDIGITTVPNICDADMMGPLRRKHLAKFLSVFAVQVLDKQVVLEDACTFSDTTTQSQEFQLFATLSCKLGLMGLNRDGTPNTTFNPDTIVTRAEFGAAFSRTLYGSTHNTPENDPRPWYQAHLQALQKDGIMTQINNPMAQEVRGYVMLMMQRAYNLLNE